MRTRLMTSKGVAIATFAATLAAAPALAQPRTQLAFGYECDNHFVVRNDGSATTDVEYGVAGGSRTPLRLEPRQSANIESASNAPMELWVNGRRVSTEPKGSKACAPPANTDVVVRPLSSTDNASGGYDATYVIQEQPRVVYVTAPVVPIYSSVYASAYGSYYAPYFDPYTGYGLGYGYGYGYGSGYRAPIFSLRGPYSGIVTRPVSRPGGYLTGRTAHRK